MRYSSLGVVSPSRHVQKRCVSTLYTNDISDSSLTTSKRSGTLCDSKYQRPSGDQRGGVPKDGVPKGGGGPKFRFFFPSPTPIFVLFFPLWESFRGILVVFLKARNPEISTFGLSDCHVKLRRLRGPWTSHENPKTPNVHIWASRSAQKSPKSTRRHTVRDTKSENGDGRGKKKSEILGGPAEGGGVWRRGVRRRIVRQKGDPAERIRWWGDRRAIQTTTTPPKRITTTTTHNHNNKQPQETTTHNNTTHTTTTQTSQQRSTPTTTQHTKIDCPKWIDQNWIARSRPCSMMSRRSDVVIIFQSRELRSIPQIRTLYALVLETKTDSFVLTQRASNIMDRSQRNDITHTSFSYPIWYLIRRRDQVVRKDEVSLSIVVEQEVFNRPFDTSVANAQNSKRLDTSSRQVHVLSELLHS